MATLKDIARRAKVSVSTASRILSGSERANELLPATRQRVLEVAKEFDYQPNTSARFLRTGQTITQIAYAFYAPREVISTEPFFIKVLEGIEIATLDLKWALHYICLNDARALDILIERINNGTIKGLILAGYFSPELVKKLLETRVPAVAVGPFYALPDLTRIEIDHQEGIELLLNYLLNLGHTSIGFVSGSDAEIELPPFKLKRDNYLKILKEHGLATNNIFIIPNWTSYKYRQTNLESIFKQLLTLSRNCTALVCANDLVARVVLSVLQTHNVKVPEECSITGFDNIEWSSYLTPPLTTASVPIAAMGKKAVDILDKLINKRPVSDQIYVVKPKIIIRKSTGPPRTSDI
jgi:DNA-binding LacI/PurR family transcriptional regulator